VEQPGSPDSWKLIQRRAQANAEIYEAVFDWVPRSRVISGDESKPGSIIPNWNSTKSLVPGKVGAPNSPLPYQEEYWQSSPVIDASRLSAVRGFICAVPVEWTQGENNHIPFPTSVIVRNEPVPPPGSQPPTALASSDSQRDRAREGAA
jgi:phospholipase D1/2